MKKMCKKCLGLLLSMLCIVMLVTGCQKTGKVEDATSTQERQETTKEDENDYFDVEDASEEYTGEADYSKYEEKSASGDATISDGSQTGKDEYGTDPVPEGRQKPVEPEDAKVDKSKKYQCYLTVSCETILNNMDDLQDGKEIVVPDNGIIYGRRAVTFYKGESVFDVLQREMKNKKIHLDAAFTPGYNSHYVRGINNIYEGDCGDPSGWMYCVNGWYPNYGCSRYAVQDGDEIEWNFTCDGGNGLGQIWM